jgi:hypothetical protein
MCDRFKAFIIVSDGEKVSAFHPNCKQWGCTSCGPELQKKLIATALSGHPNKFLTLTVDPKICDASEKNRVLITKHFNLFMRWWRRQFPNVPIEYLWRIERHKSGQPHIHILIRSPFLHWTQISKAWKRITGAYIIRIKAIDSTARAAYYVSKYMTKDCSNWKNKRIFSKSRGYVLEPITNIKPRSATAQLRVMNHLPMERYVELLREDGFIITSRTIWRCEAYHPGGARAPPLWNCTVDVRELQRPRRRKSAEHESAAAEL